MILVETFQFYQSDGFFGCCDYTISLDWNDYINWIKDKYKVVINESNCGLIIDDTRLDSDITDFIFRTY